MLFSVCISYLVWIWMQVDYYGTHMWNVFFCINVIHLNDIRMTREVEKWKRKKTKNEKVKWGERKTEEKKTENLYYVATFRHYYLCMCTGPKEIPLDKYPQIGWKDQCEWKKNEKIEMKKTHRINGNIVITILSIRNTKGKNMIRIVCFPFCFKMQTILELNWREKGCPTESFHKTTKPYSMANNKANHMDETSE